MNPAVILNQLRARGQRLTPIRRAVLAVLAGSTQPLTPQEILTALTEQGIAANKTSIYRQLTFLQTAKIIHVVHFADRTKRYELIDDTGHHHHLVCLRCHKVEDIDLPTDLQQQEQLIWNQHHFQVQHHSLEFFGVCQECQEKT